MNKLKNKMELISSDTDPHIMKSIVNFKMQVEFPPEVDLREFPEHPFSIWDLNDYLELFADYNRINMRNTYFPIKNTEFRWVFFLDSYEKYDHNESKDLQLAPVFSQKWYRGKFMTIVFLDKKFKFHKYVIPATKQDYSENKGLFDKLYQILSHNDDYVGKYITRSKSKEYL